MATAYVLASTVRTRLGKRATPLLDRDGDGAEDDGLLTDIIDEAGATIDGRLAQKLATPFALISDDPSTPDLIQRIALQLCLWDIYSWHEPDGRDATAAFDKADAWLEGLRTGAMDVNGAARQTAAKSGRVATYASPELTYTDASGDDPLLGV